MSQQAEGNRPALSEVFHRHMKGSDTNLPVAFIAVLDELDRRQRLVEADMDENARLFNHMADRLDTVATAQDRMPGELRRTTQTALRAIQPELQRQSHDGAREGATATTRAIEALQSAAEGYQARKAGLTTLAAFSLPAAFCAALALGFLFGSFAIPNLPASWQWTCKTIGAEHTTQNNGASFCFIRKR